jgi:3-methyladenine DNA glycosylase AlkC
MADSQNIPFKNYYGVALAQDIADKILRVYPDFPVRDFITYAAERLEPLELKARVATIAEGLRRYLPEKYPDALNIILAILGPELPDDGGMFNEGFDVLPLATFVELYGLDDFDLSLPALYEITKRFSSEFAVRPFIVRYPDQTLAWLKQHLADPNQHVRRWISEGTRPRLPWGLQLTAFVKDPSPTLALLEHLKDDPSAYVRKSVANHLNDITKDHPQRVLETLERWQQDAPQNRQWIIQHALRTLVKKGDARALAILGYAQTTAFSVAQLHVAPPHIKLGDSVRLSVQVTNTATHDQNLVLDYRVHYVKANGKTSPKVFKWTTRTLAAGETIALEKSHAMKPVTTRTHYAGQHKVDVQLNGQVLAETHFELTL